MSIIEAGAVAVESALWPRGQVLRPSDFTLSWDETEVEQSVPACFEKQVLQVGDRLALKYGDESLTYDELNRAANRLARAILARRGPEPEPVALLLEPGIAAIVAILAVLKAGKFYVPLDPGFPRARLDGILDDSGARLLVSNGRNEPVAAELSRGIAWLNLDTVGNSFSNDNPKLDIRPDAYLNIMYTSGSSGAPKGVLQTHRNLLYAVRISDRPNTRPDDHVALLNSYSFGVSAAIIFSALLYGAALFPFDLKKEGVGRLAQWLMEEGISSFHSVPTVFRHLVATLKGTEHFPRLRLIKLGGEPILKHDAMLLRKHFPKTCLLRASLGTTEAYASTFYFVAAETELTEAIIPAGYAVDDTEVLILDEDGRRLGFGAVGEIAIRGCYISPGYWRKPEQTARVFLDDPDGGGRRIYLTGDLGRLRLDGCLEHLGRRDFQVKVRGQRVEMAEVEMALLEVDGVKEAVVEARPERGETRLVAYVVPTRQPAPTAGALRAALTARLPGYMIPAAFVEMAQLPLLPFGKVDRRALPAPRWERPVLTTAYVAPRTPLEELLAQIWGEVLGLEAREDRAAVGVHDSFFELGGHSLLATQVAARVSSACDVDLQVSALFEVHTVAELALVVTQRLAAKVEDAELERLLQEIGA